MAVVRERQNDPSINMQVRKARRTPSVGPVRLDSVRGILFIEVNAVHNDASWSTIIDSIRSTKAVSMISVHGYRSINPKQHNAGAQEKMEKGKQQSLVKSRLSGSGECILSADREEFGSANEQLMTELCTALADAVRMNDKLRRVHIHGLRLSHGAMRELASGVSNAVNLEELSMANCALGDAAVRVLLGALQKPTKERERHGASRLCKLRLLDLSNCHLGSRAAESMAQLIVCQSEVQGGKEVLGGLQRLSLSDNPKVGDAGVRLLLEAIVNTGSKCRLRALDLLNVGATDRIGSFALAALGLGDVSFNCLQLLDLRSNAAVSRETLRAVLKKALRNALGSEADGKPTRKRGEFVWTDLRNRRSCVCDRLEEVAEKPVQVQPKVNKRSQSASNVPPGRDVPDGLSEVLKFASSPAHHVPRPVTQNVSNRQVHTNSNAPMTPERRARLLRRHRSRSDPGLRRREDTEDQKDTAKKPLRPAANSVKTGMDVLHKAKVEYGGRLSGNLMELDRRIAALRSENSALKEELDSIKTIAARVRFVRDSKMLETLAEAFANFETLLVALEKGQARSLTADAESARRVLRDARRLCGFESSSSATSSPAKY